MTTVCVEGALVPVPAQAGVPCMMGGNVCDGKGACIDCIVGADCPGADTPCRQRACNQSECGYTFTPAGTPVEHQSAGDCKRAVCNGEGALVQEDDDTDVCGDGVATSCVAGSCVAPACEGRLGLPGLPVNIVPEQPQGIVDGDFDGNGIADLAVMSHFGAAVSVLLGAGDGSFTTGASYLLNATPTQLVAADLNGDAALDLVVVSKYADEVSLLFNQGDGFFAPAQELDVGMPSRAVTAADLNGDGAVDLAIVHDFSGMVRVLLNQGGGDLVAAGDVGQLGNPEAIAAADLEGDGDMDLAVVNGLGVGVLLNPGNALFAPPLTYYSVGDSPKGLVVADLSGDGKPDLAASGAGVGVREGPPRSCAPFSDSENTS